MAIVMESLRETKFFDENEVTVAEMKDIFISALRDKFLRMGHIKVGDDVDSYTTMYTDLENYEIDECLIKGVEKGVDNTLTSLQAKGAVSLEVTPNGIAYKVTEKGERMVTNNVVVGILKGKVK